MNRGNKPKQPQMRYNPYPPLDSISTSLDQEVYRVEPTKEKNYKPLLALNIDIGDVNPARVLVYDFTDPWKRAYEFLQDNNLPEEMHEDIAMLISNAKDAKEKELKMQRLASDKQGAFVAGTKLNYQKQDQPGKYRNNPPKRNASCELKQSNSTKLHSGVGCITQPKDSTRRVLFEQFEHLVPAQPIPAPTLLRNNSSDNYKQSTLFGSDPNHHSKAKNNRLDSEGQLPQPLGVKEVAGEKSTVLDSTTLLSNNSEKDKSQSTNMKASPFESRIGELSDLSSSNINVQQPWTISGGPFNVEGAGQATIMNGRSVTILATSNRPSDNRSSSVYSNQDQMPFPQSPLNTTADHEKKVLELFNRLDYDNIGVIRSFDVYLSNLTSETKNLIHSILSLYDRPNGFRSFNMDCFRAVLLQSSLFPSLSLEPAQH